ncbi:MAG: DEAD/DEAH box helicase family protein [Thermoguttaceae bacterium]|jgi:type III restriction enzyme
MRIQFESNQQFQLDAIQAVLDVFDGQPLAQGEYEIRFDTAGGELVSHLGVGNRLSLDASTILANVQTVQKRNEIKPAADGLDANGMNFSVEMETGTGKTYVYLRTIYELNRTYGFKKFVIVVPSVAIREGVLKNIELTRDHFRAIYGNVPLDYWVYDSKQVSRLRGFANSNQLQILIINIDSFNKKENNVIHQDRDQTLGRKPIEFLQATFPIVVVDEPQNMESDLARAAIASLNPLCMLRYSATHRHAYNLLYRLDPVRAYDLRLVKRIEVDAVLDDADFNKPFIELKSVTATKTKITAKLVIDVDSDDGPRRKTVSVSRNGTDLFDLSNERAAYRGYIVDHIDAGNGYVAFTNGLTLYTGQSHGGRTDDVMKVQIEETVKEHFEKELKVQRLLPEGQRLKVLSLFFIDRVANYFEENGKIRQWFVEAYQRIAARPQYKALKPLPVEKVHNGYFAQSRGTPKDTSGTTQADDEAYELIMRDKERLLSRDEPLRFIFSHSALREGWDNPNVFQICTLNETRSEIKKRQEIGRGLRLPVLETGQRCFDPAVNRLTVVANEMYDDFARKLQTEIEEECGVEFKGRIANKRDRRKAELVAGWRLNPDFQALWERIKHRTRYSVDYATAELIAKAGKAVRKMPAIEPPKLMAIKSEMEITEEGIVGKLSSAREVKPSGERSAPIPDMLSYLQRETELTRSTLADILIESGRLGEVVVNPQQFMDQAVRAIRQTLHKMIIDGIKYEKIGDAVYEMLLFEEKEIESYVDRMVDVGNSIYDCLECESDTERKFAEAMRDRTDIKLFIKLPDWFKVETPIGTYNPDWAIVKQEDDRIYLVRETKATKDQLALRGAEWEKIRCGKAHFNALGVDFKQVISATEV